MGLVYFICVLIILMVKHGNGQLLNFGPCPVVKTVEYFDIERFLGHWYIIEKYPTFYEYGNCSRKTFESCGRRIEIEHIFVRDNIQYVFKANSSYNPGDDAVFETQENIIDQIGAPLKVIATDYSNYALLYGCKYDATVNIKYTYVWIASRNQTLSEETIQDLKMTLYEIPYGSPTFLRRQSHDLRSCAHDWTAVSSPDSG